MKEKDENQEVIKSKKKSRKSNDIKTSVSFNLIEVLLIILMTGIVVSVVSGVIVYNNFDRINKRNINNNEEAISKSDLNKFENNYNRLLNRYVKEIDKDKLLEAAIKGMYDYLGDDYTKYIDKDDSSNINEQLQGEYDGIGVEITSGITTEGYINVITKIFEGTPASEAGFKVGDVILELDGVKLTDKDSAYVANTIKYGKEEEHTLKILRGDKDLSIKVSRNHVTLKYVTSNIIDNKIGYIKIDTFANTTATQLRNELNKMNKNIKSIIIDLRDNGGGYLTSAFEICDMFVDKGTNIYQVKDRSNKVQIYKAQKGIYRKFDNIVVLINGNTASASEIFTLCLKENLNAKIVGTKSFGKGTVQETDILENGAMIKYTSAYWLSPKGNTINEIGIKPDIEEKDVNKQLDAAKRAIK